MTPKRSDHEQCVLTGVAGSTETWCGGSRRGFFVDAGHAALAAKQNTTTTVCRQCAAAIRAALTPKQQLESTARDRELVEYTRAAAEQCVHRHSGDSLGGHLAITRIDREAIIRRVNAQHPPLDVEAMLAVERERCAKAVYDDDADDHTHAVLDEAAQRIRAIGHESAEERAAEKARTK